MPLLDSERCFLTITGEEARLDKVVLFDEGPISAIGYQLNSKVMKPLASTPAGTIALFTRAGSELLTGHYGAILSRGWPSNEQLHYIPLDYDSRPERQVRKVISLLEKEGVITSEQRGKAYDELGLEEELYKRPVKEGRVF